MRAGEFYEFGQQLRGAVDPLLPEEMRQAPKQPAQPLIGQ